MTEREYVERFKAKAEAYVQTVSRLGDGTAMPEVDAAAVQAWEHAKAFASPFTMIRMADAWLAANAANREREGPLCAVCPLDEPARERVKLGLRHYRSTRRIRLWS
jgi:hypothetical protein